MGMAASQARFLQLTARKNNVEFEGQQINQQRTTLSNQSANYYNQLLGMNVPVAPSVDEYTKTVYTFNDGALTNTVTSLIAKDDGTYLLSYLQQYQDDFTPVSAAKSVVTNTDGTTYKIGADTLRKLTTSNSSGGGTVIPDTDTDTDIETDTDTDIDTDTDSEEQLTKVLLTEAEKNQVKVASLNSTTGFFETNSDGSIKETNLSTYTDGTYSNPIYYIYDNTQTGYEDAIIYVEKGDDGNYYKLTEEEGTTTPAITASAADVSTAETTVAESVVVSDATNVNPNDLSTLTEEEKEATETEEQYYEQLLNEKYGTPANGWYVRYVKDSTTGTYKPYFYNGDELANISTGESKSVNCYAMGSETKSIEIKGVEGVEIEKDSTGRFINISIPDESGTKVTYALTTTTTTDETAYNDAMNQYEYDKYQYDQTIQEINAKIEVIQAQDKNLELHLKQLDTEQEAISTEIESVSKVIEKNTESSFKTFG